FSLANNIDLSEYKDANGNPVDWTGPSGFSGKLYGNGHAIKNLVLSKTGGDTGLLTSLGNNAVLQDFTIEVSTSSPVRPRTNNSHFGGVVGYATGSNIKIKNVAVKGELIYGPVNIGNYLLAGGIIGEMSPTSSVTLEKCVSELNITLQQGTQSGSSGTLGFGGLVGKAYGSLTIKQCYATGNITLNHNGNRRLWAGGLVGQKYGGSLKIEESYASGNVIATNAVSANAMFTISGGLVGTGAMESAATVTLLRSAALNENALAVTTRAQDSLSGRLIAHPRSSGNVYTNNIARKGMYTGNTNPGTANETEGSENALEGLAKTVDELKNTATWTALGWNETDWDFSGLSQGKWPTLK
ncbi:MAG: hypothetical protein LBC77_01785, partial [Spirochaetaceae bacterium]|nr:hypothetical protein [Spirochaetaceae bacterium]